MSPFTDNSGFGLGDDRGGFGHCTSTSQQQYTPSIGNSPSNNLEWTNEPRRASHVRTGVAPSTTPWSATTFHPSVYRGNVLPGEQRIQAPLGPSFSASGRSGPSWGAAPAVPGRPSPPVQDGLPASQPTPLEWTQVTGPPLQPTSWDLPVWATVQNGVHYGSTGLDETRPEGSWFQSLASSLASGHSERNIMQPDRLSLTATLHSVRSSTHSDPVPIAPPMPQPRSERYDLSLATTMFPCMWSSGGMRCTALIAGDRRSVTGHLRDEHGFTCDGQSIVCAWDQCTTWVQRRNVPRHIVACHFEVKVICERCGMSLCRADANKKHQLACTGGA